MPEADTIRLVLERDRLVLVAGLAVVIALAWAWILFGAGTGGGSEMSGMPGMVMKPSVWTRGYAGLMFFMWWVMMAAMMLPGAAPTLLLFARINRKEGAGRPPYVPTGVFAAGYLTAWGGFSLLATGCQWGLERLGVLSAAMATSSVWLAGAILITAGMWQLTPIKSICLRHCRSPIGFLARSWRPGRSGAFRMGLQHGTYCLGCCWFLMGLLFVGGIMNLYWIGGLATFILLEKISPMGSRLGPIAGVGLMAWGALVLMMAS